MQKVGLMCGALLFLLAGCGQKGPLYLPQSAKPSSHAPKAVPVPPSKQNSTVPDSTTQDPNVQDFDAHDLENQDLKRARTGN